MKSDKLGTGGGRTGTSHARDSPYRNALGGGAPQCALLAKHHVEPATASTKPGGHCAGTTPNAHPDDVPVGLRELDTVTLDDGMGVDKAVDPSSTWYSKLPWLPPRVSEFQMNGT